MVNHPDETFPHAAVSLFAPDFMLDLNSRTQRSDAPILAPDAVTVMAGGRTMVRVPGWATQALSSVLLQWSRGAPLFWTNQAQSLSHADPSGPQTHSVQSLPLRLTNHFNRVLFTNTRPAEMPLKVLSLEATLAPTNLLNPVYLLEWQVRWLGNPTAQP